MNIVTPIRDLFSVQGNGIHLTMSPKALFVVHFMLKFSLAMLLLPLRCRRCSCCCCCCCCSHFRCVQPIVNVQQTKQVVLSIVWIRLNGKFAINDNWLHWSIYLSYSHSSWMHNWARLIFKVNACLRITRNYRHTDLQMVYHIGVYLYAKTLA